MIGKPEGVRRAKHSIDIVIDGDDPAQVAVEKAFIGAFGKKFAVRKDLHPPNRRVLRVLPGGLREAQR